MTRADQQAKGPATAPVSPSLTSGRPGDAPLPGGAGGGAERTKRRLLDLLKRGGGRTAQDLASQLEVTVPAARRHLGDLMDRGLIEVRVEKPAGRGRPQHVYLLTERGEATFPRTYAALCVDVLRHVQSLYGQDAVLRVLEARNGQWGELIRPELDATRSLGDRLTLLGAHLTDSGFDVHLDVIPEPGGVTWVLTQRNCPNLTVARHFPELCEAELRLLRDLTGLPLVRDARIVTGQVHCRYRVTVPADQETVAASSPERAHPEREQGRGPGGPGNGCACACGAGETG